VADDRDAVTFALADLGRVEPLRADDVARARSTFAGFHAARRRRRLRAVGVAVCSMAAAIALTFMVAPLLRGRGFEVVEGEFLVQQGRVDAGNRVASGEWIEPGSGRACVKVGARRVCGEPGARLRVLDDDRVELERGRLSADGAIEVETAIGVVRGHDEGLDVAMDPDDQALLVDGPAITLMRDGAEVEVPTGGRATHGGAVAALAQAQPPAVAPEVVTDRDAPEEPTVTPPPERATARTPRPPKPVAVVVPAGEMLASARELASGGKLAAAATAYQRLLDAHPSSGEARAALVSLGRVQASRGRHAAALAAFTRYLAGGAGPLGEEAHFGRVAALDALGRDAERDRAIAALESAHPNSVYLPKARALAAK
jgi:hypothetical protein